MADLDDLTDDERATIVAVLRQTIDRDRYLTLPIACLSDDTTVIGAVVAPGFGFDVPEIADLSRQAADFVGVGRSVTSVAVAAIRQQRIENIRTGHPGVRVPSGMSSNDFTQTP